MTFVTSKKIVSIAFFGFFFIGMVSPIFGQSVPLEPSELQRSSNYTQYLQQLEGAPQQMALIRPEVLSLIHLLSNMESATDNQAKKFAANAIALELENSTMLVTSQPIILDAYSRLIDFSISNEDFVKSVQYADSVIRLYQIQQFENSRSLWRVYMKRGISRFRNGVNNPPRNIDWRRPSSISFWVDALLDLRKARVLYGSPRQMNDPDYYGIVAWDLAVNAYVDSRQLVTSQIENEMTHNIINPSRAIVATYWHNGAACGAYGRASPYVNLANYPAFATIKYGGAVGLYDLDATGVANNIRIVSIIPGNELTQLATEAIAKARFPIDSENVPELCKNNRIAVIKFGNRAGRN